MARNPRRPLDPHSIVQAGLDLVAASGIEAVSFRNLAKQLGVTPMALYRHFDDKEALLSAMLDRFIEQSDVLPHRKVSWEKWMAHVSDRMYRALISQPSWIPLLGDVPLRQSGLKVMDECLRVLTTAGFTAQQAMEGFLGMIHILLGAALMSCQLNKGYPKANVDTLIEDIQNDYPQLQQSLTQLQRLSIQTLIQPAMALLIAGMKQKL